MSLTYTNSDKKVKPEYTIPAGLTATYGETLNDVEFSEVSGGAFSWENPTEKVGDVGTNTFPATFTPDDTTLYETVTGIDVEVTVGKAVYSGASIETTTNVASNMGGLSENKDYTYDLGQLVSGRDGFKNMAYTLGATTDDSSLLAAGPTLNGNTLGYTAKPMAAGTSATVAVTISSLNYEDVAATLTIKSADKKTANVTVSQAGGTYGTALAVPNCSVSQSGANPSWSYLYEGTITQGNTSYSSATAPTMAGVYTVKATYMDDEYYGVGTSTQFTIAPKAVTATVNAATREYGAANPTFTANCSGLAYSDTVADLGLSLSSTANASSAPSQYDVTGTAANKNYSVTVNGAGKLNVTKARITGITETDPAGITIWANDAKNTAADLLAMVKPTTTAATYTNGTTNLDISWKLTSGTYNVKGGNYTYTGTVQGTDNFDVTGIQPLTATVTVTPVIGTINGVSTAKKMVVNTLSDWTHTGFGLPTSAAVAYDNGVAGGTVNVTWTPAASTLAKTVKATQTFSIDLSIFPEWATISTVSVPVEVTDKFPINMEVKAPADVIYGTAVGEPTSTPTAIDNGVDSAGTVKYTYNGTALDGTVLANSEAKPTKAGTYTVTATYVSQTHAGEASDTFTISPKPLTVTATCAGKVYDGTTTAAVSFGALNSGDFVGGDKPAVMGGKASYDAAGAGNRTVTVSDYAIDNKNYTAANATVTINNVTISKATPKIALQNLTQSQNSAGGGIVPVTLTLNPASATAVPTVEYYVLVTATQAAVTTVEAVACDHNPGTTPCAATTGAFCPHTDGCAYVEGVAGRPEIPAVYNWTTQLPTAVGKYPVRGYLPAGDGNLNAVTVSDAAIGTLTISGYVAPDNGGHHSGGGGGGGGSTTTPTTSTDKVTVSTSTTAKTESGGKATAAVSEKAMSDSLKKAQDALDAAQKAGNKNATAEVKVEVNGAANATAIETSIPAESVKAVADAGDTSLTIESAVANVTFDENALNTITKEAEGSDIKVSVAKIDKSQLSLFERLVTLTRPVYQLTVTSGDKEISSFGNGEAEVRLPYTLRSNEKPENIRIFYVDSDGNLNIVKNVKYDEKTKTVVFTTSHFSYYAIGYESVSFSDVSAEDWYYTPVMYLAEEGIVKGKSATRFGSEDNITRAEFVQILYNQNGTPQVSSSNKFKDVKADDWYANAVNWAAANGIAAGSGERFNPNANITRQELAVMLGNFYKFKGQEVNGSQTALAKFTDAAGVADWAKTGVSFCSDKGLISGYTNGTFRPTNTATRAEAAQMITSMLLNLGK